MDIQNKIIIIKKPHKPKILGANLTKQAQDLYATNGKILMKETNLNINEETFYVHGMGDST